VKMLTFKVDARRLKRKFEGVNAAVEERVGEAFELGYTVLVGMTPMDTGFLKASWYQSVGGSPGSHPNPPDEVMKSKLRYPAGPQPEFVANYTANIADAGLMNYAVGMQAGDLAKANIAVSVVTWRNTAPYAAGLNEGTLANGRWAQWADNATEAASNAVKNYLRSVDLKLHTR
jgi:hypothetical protein